ncbi:NAD(P)-dependent dehydrogenase (short-subunit alcohol dehydrogenase family) [Sphingobium sp. OAS761]|uniref:SDR family NAD(P)-dependent oxidoreductase n=1 Tax=Sphingobium sp. OAS761 TaxID=2817901 RepID=UPI00209CF8FC|nr:SDR family NAD(P)-dependent oxidoreductase [Sphingobium sp. OAS761]MCP1471775.1 NAD(P)-dependent dehydrogenase (short-subunit alcohol dehydrogenase family) [Sphingobium sp. OAS761]
MEIRDVPVIVTGGASGLGSATAERLAEGGAKVALFDLNAEAGEPVARRIGGSFHRVDVTSADSVDGGLAAAQESHGPARILVNCAGIAPAIRVVAKDGTPHPLDAFRKAVEINLVGTFNVLSQFAARLIAANIDGEEAGVIVNTASVAAYDGQIGQAAYAASKGGVVGLTLPVARDLAQHRIRVMTIAPGIFLTPMMMGLPQAARDSLGTQVPHPSRLGRPEEYAQLVESIVANSMLNGDVVRLDGAIRMAPR